MSEMYYLGLGKKYGFTLDTPIKDMSTEAVNALLYGTNGEKIEMHRTNEFGSGVYYNTFEGIVENLERRFRETNSEWMKEEIGSFMSGVECPGCHGRRLKPVVLAVTVGDKNISEFCEMSIREELEFIRENEPNLTEKQKQIGGQILKAKQALDQFKMEVADELGVPLTNGYNGNLTSYQNGSVGGYMVKKMIEKQEKEMSNK